MELKPHNQTYLYVYMTLLIVPYGIETCLKHSKDPKHHLLLIVPYGIET